MTLAEIMKDARKTRGLKLKEVARLAKLKVAAISAIENGRVKRPKMDTLYKLIIFYGLNLDETCVIAERVPQDCFFKIIRNPDLMKLIRNYPEGK